MRSTRARCLGLRDATAASGRRLPPGRLRQRLIQMGDRVLKQVDKPRSIDRARVAYPVFEADGAAVQQQLGHTNPAYSMQYARITNKELADVLEDR